MKLLEETLFTCAAVPNKNERTKKWHAQTIDNEESKIAFSTKKDALLYIKDRQCNLRAQSPVDAVVRWKHHLER